MGTILEAPPVKLFVGLLTAQAGLVERTAAALEELYGPIELRGGPFPFEDTDYYTAEMGSPLERYFLGFERLIQPERLPEIKRSTNGLERGPALGTQEAKRPVNLDPGYLEAGKLVLASTKNFYHRILLDRGIYGEVTLAWRSGGWEPFPWTFPDFRSRRYDNFFTALRSRYRAQLAESRE
jgi:hypothetical protein